MEPQGREILVADDEPAVAAALTAALKFAGFRVTVARDGEEALALARADVGRFTVVITDHNMPGAGGLHLVDGLRQAGYAGGVVVLSAFLSGDVEARYRALGVDEVLAKPFHLDALLRVVKRLCEPTPAA